MDKIRVLIADDHPIVREGLSATLSAEPDMTVVGEATNGIEAVEMSLATKPDVILIDLRMPVLDGATAMQRIRAQNRAVKFIVLTTYDTEEYVFKAIQAGAQSYLLKDVPSDEIVEAIRNIVSGKSVIEPAIANRVLERFSQMMSQVSQLRVLSDREIEVLKLMAKGEYNREIAATLSISESTVKTHIQSIFQKLDVKSRTEAIAKARTQAMIDLYLQQLPITRLFF
jgi:DNA-binding NarL/FixJ family response regulator